MRIIQGEYQMKNGLTDLDSGLFVLLQDYLGKTTIWRLRKKTPGKIWAKLTRNVDENSINREKIAYLELSKNSLVILARDVPLWVMGRADRGLNEIWSTWFTGAMMKSRVLCDESHRNPTEGRFSLSWPMVSH